MDADLKELLDEVQAGLQARKGQWKQIAADLPEVSYSWIAQVGRDKYESEPAYSRLKAVAKWLREHPLPPVGEPATEASAA